MTSLSPLLSPARSPIASPTEMPYVTTVACDTTVKGYTNVKRNHTYPRAD